MRFWRRAIGMNLPLRSPEAIEELKERPAKRFKSMILTACLDESGTQGDSPVHNYGEGC